jgi:hypothetical protein
MRKEQIDEINMMSRGGIKERRLSIWWLDIPYNSIFAFGYTQYQVTKPASDGDFQVGSGSKWYGILHLQLKVTRCSDLFYEKFNLTVRISASQWLP